jgi:hypothetical protein
MRRRAGMYRGPADRVGLGTAIDARRAAVDDSGLGNTRMFEAFEVVLPMGVQALGIIDVVVALLC